MNGDGSLLTLFTYLIVLLLFDTKIPCHLLYLVYTHHSLDVWYARKSKMLGKGFHNGKHIIIFNAKLVT